MTLYLGYDPGGDKKHGVAELSLDHSTGAVTRVQTSLASNADAALAHFRSRGAQDEPIGGIGIDTLTEWCLGNAGWRPADLWLRATYPAAKNSVVNPNYINGNCSPPRRAPAFFS